MSQSFGDFEINLTAGEEASAARRQSAAPFCLAILGDFSGRANRGIHKSGKELALQKPVSFDVDDFDEVLAKLNVELELTLADDDHLTIPLRFAELDDFHPDKIFERVGLFQRLRQTRKKLLNEATFKAAAAEVRSWVKIDTPPEPAKSAQVETPPPDPAGFNLGNLLDDIVGKTQERQQQVAEAQTEDEFRAFLRHTVSPYLVPDNDAEREELIDYVDASISELMRAILHHRDFQNLEAAWRAAFLLARRIETGPELKLFLVDIAKAEWLADLNAAENIRDTTLYKILVEQTLETPGGEPWAVVVGNYTFTDREEDTEALTRVAKIAHRAGAPFLAAASPQILGCQSLAETPDPADWHSSAEGDKRWEALRSLPEAAQIGLALPRFLLRLPYGKDTEPAELFEFEEMSGPAKPENYLWGNPAFISALLLAQAFSEYGWDFAESPLGQVTDMPTHIYQEQGETKVQPCTEILLTERGAERLLEKGLMPLVSFRNRQEIRLLRLQPLAS